MGKRAVAALVAFKRVTQALDLALVHCVWVIFAYMVLLLVVQVVGRYVFGFSPVWVVESSMYSFVWLSFLGICMAYRRGAHISLEYLWDRAPPPIRSTLKSVIRLSVLGISLAMTYGGIELLQVFGSTRSPGMDIPMTWVYSAIVVCGVLLVLFTVELALADLGLLARPVQAKGSAEIEDCP